MKRFVLRVSHATTAATIRQNDIILPDAAYVVIVDMVREAGNIRINVGSGGWTSINTTGETVLTFRSRSGNDFVVDIPATFSGRINRIEVKGVVVIEYNHLNLPEYVSKGPQQQMRYIYDARGRKISQEVYKEGGLIAKKSDYAGEFFYENDTLRFMSHEEGRVVMADTVPEYQEDLKNITQGNLDDVQHLPETIEQQATKIEGIGELQKQSGVLDQHKAKLEDFKDPNKAKEKVIEVARKAATDHFAGKQEQLKAAMEKLSEYKQKYSSVSSIKDLPKRPRVRRSDWGRLLAFSSR